MADDETGADTDTDMEQTSARAAVDDADGLFDKLKKWFKADYESHGHVKWRKEAREDFAFESGDQLTEEDKKILQEMNRPVVVFNRIGVTVDSVAGQEVANRQEVQFVPRTLGVVKVNELMTSAARWFRQQADAEDEESDAFRDTVICGMGWTETRLDYEDNPEGKPVIDRIDPLAMVWDRGAKKRNLVDAKRVFHIERNMSLEDARALCPGDPKRPFADEDYNASWVDMGQEDDGADPHENDGHFYNKDQDGKQNDPEAGVTLIRAQWWERVPAYLMLDPADPEGKKILTLSQDEYAAYQAKYKLAGAPMPKTVKTTKKVYRQAYIGNVLLEIGDAPVPGHFSFKCITGKRDRNKNTFYGIVRAMKDPARWSNKWMSQTMHIFNSSAKGGIAVESGQFFEDDTQGEESWARSETVTRLKPGALGGNPKFVQKPTAQLPAASMQLMEFAVNSLPQVSGVNIETLGMQADASQAASLDRQRKQSVMIILQPLFDGLRRYRKEQGRLMLYLIQHFLSDGRLIKIEGPDEAQYVPLIKQADAEYDVIADESPTSANQKEQVWATLNQILPVIGKMLPPAVWMALIKYSPLPTSAQQDIKQAMDSAAQQPNPEQQKADAELKLEQDKANAKMANDKQASDAKIAQMHAESAAKLAIDREHAHNSLMLKALTAPPAVGPDGQPVQGSGGGEAAAAIMGLMQQMRQEQAELQKTMLMIAQAQSAPKQLIRDASGNITGIAPATQGA